MLTVGIKPELFLNENQSPESTQLNPIDRAILSPYTRRYGLAIMIRPNWVGFS
jgi:hypothetical protein